MRAWGCPQIFASTVVSEPLVTFSSHVELVRKSFGYLEINFSAHFVISADSKVGRLDKNLNVSLSLI